MVDLTGQVLGGRYRVDAFLGRGGMADVYKVWDMQRAVFLALKALHADLAEDKLLLRRFEQEALTLEALQHPNIVRFYGLEHTPAGVCILMDYIDGLTLRKEIFLSQGGLSGERILEVMQPVCAALYYAHQNGRVHCDIKPANIISHHNGAIYLADFGIARMTEGSTQTPIGAGTPAYMAPEQLDGHNPTPAADIYSLGVVLFEMVTGGQRPFTGESARTQGTTTRRIVWEKHHLPAPSPRKYKPDISAELEAVILRCLERKPNRRYANTLDLYQALEAAIKTASAVEDDELNTQVEIIRKASEAYSAAKAAGEKPGLRLKASLADQPDGSPAAVTGPKAAEGAREKPARNGKSAAKTETAVEQLDGLEKAGDKKATAQKTTRTANTALPSVIPAQSPPAAQASVSAADEPPDADESDDEYLPPLWRIYLTRRNLTLAAVGAVVITLLALGLLTQPAHAPTLNLTPTWDQAELPQKTALAGAVNPPAARPSPRASLTPALPGVTATATTPAASPVLQPTPMGGSKRIAFASDRSGTVQVWVMDPSSPDTREMITNESDGACQPTWSPDGTQIAYTTPCKGPSVFYPAATIKIIRLVDHNLTDLPLKGGGYFDPAWSPDGQSLAFTALVGENTIIQSINLKDKKTITTLSQRGTKNTQPAYSPDGQFIAFITSDEHHTNSLWLMRANGESQEVLSNAAQFSEPSWTPDGRYLLVSMQKNSNIPILAMVDRANPTPGGVPLLTDEFRMSRGRISMDGKWLAFFSDKVKNNLEIFLASLDDKTDLRQLTNNKLQDFQPAWEP